MLDSYTSTMCLSSWGRSTYARALIEASADKELMESLTIAIPMEKDKGHTLATIEVEYEWTPPRCSTCLIFDHKFDKCPKLPKQDIPTTKDEEGFVEVRKKKNKNRSKPQRQVDGIRFTKPPPKFHYRRVEPDDLSKPPETLNTKTLIPASKRVISVKNSFDALESAGNDDDYLPASGDKQEDVLNFSDSEVDEEIIVEKRKAASDSSNKGASTPIIQQNEVMHVILENNLSVCVILESHVVDSNLARICARVFRHWDWTSNGTCCDKGTRIILGWNHNDVDVVVITQDDQSIHTRLWLKAERKEVFCSFIYAHNKYTQRRALWRNLSMHKLYIRDRPWCLLGDFNAALFLEDSTAGRANIDISMREFCNCVEDIEVMDVQHMGLQFNWSQKPKGTNGILKKIDRIMANLAFNDQFAGAHAIFKPYRISDHSPSVVKDRWAEHICGFHMFKVVKKLKSLKKPFRKLLYDKGNIHTNVSELRTKLDSIQTLLDSDPFNTTLREAEANYVVEFNQAALLEERFLQQKAKINWLKEGDANSAYFHKTVKSRVSRSRIDTITDVEGLVYINEAVPNVFVTHYETFLGMAGETVHVNTSNLFKTCLDEQVATDMVRMVTAQEVKEAIFSMGDDKSPGPDGYSACFFKAAWEVVGDDVTNAICEYFRNGTMLKELNHTIIALIPKSVVTTYFIFYCVNGSFMGNFRGRRGLRQGDPLSPYLFTLVMEVLTLMLQRRVHESQVFTYHRYCSKLELINLCFAKDLFLFAYGDINSASIIKEALYEFKGVSGLTPSLPKSTAYFCNVLNHVLTCF
ncbi:hypothetical protein Tco_0851365 [Tanacetum coccineum]